MQAFLCQIHCSLLILAVMLYRAAHSIYLLCLLPSKVHIQQVCYKRLSIVTEHRLTEDMDNKYLQAFQ